MKLKDLADLVSVRNHLANLINNRNAITKDKIQTANHKVQELDQLFISVVLDNILDEYLPLKLCEDLGVDLHTTADNVKTNNVVAETFTVTNTDANKLKTSKPQSIDPDVAKSLKKAKRQLKKTSKKKVAVKRST
ncbi:MAG TPA: hypothetical protein VKN14_03085 [Flavobacteriaceae bacterium]|nr:hypothetical protein [Flavobacteriaceae bacterium]